MNHDQSSRSEWSLGLTSLNHWLTQHHLWLCTFLPVLFYLASFDWVVPWPWFSCRSVSDSSRLRHRSYQHHHRHHPLQPPPRLNWFDCCWQFQRDRCLVWSLESYDEHWSTIADYLQVSLDLVLNLHLLHWRHLLSDCWLMLTIALRYVYQIVYQVHHRPNLAVATVIHSFTRLVVQESAQHDFYEGFLDDFFERKWSRKASSWTQLVRLRSELTVKGSLD